MESSSRSSFWQEVDKHSVSLQMCNAPPCLESHFRNPHDSPSFIPPRKVFLTTSHPWLSAALALATKVCSSLTAADIFSLVMILLFFL